MQKGGRKKLNKQRKMFTNIHDLLINDETLLRLLYYPPAKLTMNRPEPLSDELDNILDMDMGEVWRIRDDHILESSKSDDLENKAVCRIYLYPGKIRHSLKNKRAMKQEIVLDVFVHYSYDIDHRMMSITGRLSELLFNERARCGLGRIDYRNGYDFVAPKGYTSYRHIYEIGGTK